MLWKWTRWLCTYYIQYKGGRGAFLKPHYRLLTYLTKGEISTINLSRLLLQHLLAILKVFLTFQRSLMNIGKQVVQCRLTYGNPQDYMPRQARLLKLKFHLNLSITRWWLFQKTLNKTIVSNTQFFVIQKKRRVVLYLHRRELRKSGISGNVKAIGENPVISGNVQAIEEIFDFFLFV